MRVAFEDKGDALCQARVGSNKVLIDVPRGLGGKDRAATPTQLLVVALGSCMNAMIVKYCHENDLDSAGTRMRIEYDYLEDPTRLGNFKIEITLPDHLKDRRDEIHDVVKACPVHQTMQHVEHVEIAYA
jgi:uncharacterized OsmC-like protein